VLGQLKAPNAKYTIILTVPFYIIPDLLSKIEVSKSWARDLGRYMATKGDSFNFKSQE
jgi:hypothetical protein